MMTQNEMMAIWALCAGVMAIMMFAHHYKKPALGLLCSIIFFTSAFTIITWKWFSHWCMLFGYHTHNTTWYAWLTTSFLHTSWAHLISNMVGVFVFGYLLLFSQRISGLQLLGIYVGGLWFTCYFLHINHGLDLGDQVYIGASGGVFALIGSCFCLAIGNRATSHPSYNKLLLLFFLFKMFYIRFISFYFPFLLVCAFGSSFLSVSMLKNAKPRRMCDELALLGLQGFLFLMIYCLSFSLQSRIFGALGALWTGYLYWATIEESRPQRAYDELFLLFLFLKRLHHTYRMAIGGIYVDFLYSLPPVISKIFVIPRLGDVWIPVDCTSHAGHLGGIVYGIIFFLALEGQRRTAAPQRSRRAFYQRFSVSQTRRYQRKSFLPNTMQG